VPASAPVSAESPAALLRLEGVEQFYGEKIRILGPIDLEVREGEFLSLVGPSGCGKSTLLRIVAGVLRPTAGRVLVGGRPLKGVNTRAAMVFQSFALFPWLTVVDNVAVGLEARALPLRERLKKAQKYIDLVGLSGYERAFPRELSRGMKQLVGLARARSRPRPVEVSRGDDQEHPPRHPQHRGGGRDVRPRRRIEGEPRADRRRSRSPGPAAAAPAGPAGGAGDGRPHVRSSRLR